MSDNWPRPWTLELMQAMAAERGGRCLSSKYGNSHKNLEWECAQGHRWQASPGNIKKGSWCRLCVHDRRRGSLDEMRAIAAERGGRCLSNHYVNANTHLDWECAEGHRWPATPSHVKERKWCRVCAGVRSRGTLQNIQAIAESRGGRCLSDRYAGSKALHWFECQHGHRWRTTPHHIKEGHWCGRCHQDKMHEAFDRVRAIAVNRGGQCLSDTYVNADTPLRWRCAHGHEWETAPRKITAKSWCVRCGFDKRRLTIDQMHAIAAERGGRCLSEHYVNTHTRLTWQCDQGHVWQATPAHVKSGGQWCRKCYLEGLTKSTQPRRRKIGVPVRL